MSKELEEEVFGPRSELHLLADWLVAGMCRQDVVCDASDDGQVFWRVVLSGPGAVFLEYYVKLPVQSVFDGPMLTEEFQSLLRREAPVRYHVAGLCLGFSLGVGSLGLDADHARDIGPGPAGERGCIADLERGGEG